MRDPYDILGIRPGATFEDVKSAYRRACKTKHPDMGGSQEAFVELQNAYEAVLTDLRRGHQTQQTEPHREHAASSRDTERREQTYRDIDDELEELRRSARAREEALRAMRSQLWEHGDKVAWARFTWRDVTRFLGEITRGGAKGLALLCAVLIGIGSVLVEANAVSAVIMFGAGVGFVFSQALKSDKGGMLSAGLLLFGVMTIWLLPVRQALVHYPLATISLLLCLALIFKFGQQGGIVGLLTGGLLTLYVVAVILAQTPQLVSNFRPPAGPEEPTTPTSPAPRLPRNGANIPRSAPVVSNRTRLPVPEIRELIASKNAIFRFVPGVAYRLRVRGGLTTSIGAVRGRLAPYQDNEQVGVCTDRLNITAPAGTTPYVVADTSYRSCDEDALLRVIDVR